LPKLPKTTFEKEKITLKVEYSKKKHGSVPNTVFFLEGAGGGQNSFRARFTKTRNGTGVEYPFIPI